MSFRILIAGLVLAIGVAGLAQGAVFYSNPYDSDSEYAWGSDNQFPQHCFTDYYWDGGFSITDFHWWGGSSEGANQSNINGFYLKIYAHDASQGHPGGVLFSEYFAGDAGATFVESNSQYPGDVFKYGVDLTTAFTPAAAGYYWFSVVANVADDTHWYWAQSDGDPFNPDVLYYADTWSDDLGEDGFAFEISGDGSTVPEPTTLALFGVGLVGLAMRKRRRK